jgi:hypothetical protein
MITLQKRGSGWMELKDDGELLKTSPFLFHLDNSDEVIATLEKAAIDVEKRRRTTTDYMQNCDNVKLIRQTIAKILIACETNNQIN